MYIFVCIIKERGKSVLGVLEPMKIKASDREYKTDGIEKSLS